jgi:FkbM family methyltransferase
MITDRLYRSFARAPILQKQLRRIVGRLPHRVREIEHFGQRLRIDPSELAGFYLYYEQEYDDFIFRFLEPKLASFDRALDIGAHYGIYSVFLGARMKRVDAFEPDKKTIRWLHGNLALNGLSTVTVHEKCIAQETGHVSFWTPPETNRGLARIATPGEASAPLASLSLDDFLGGSNRDSCLVKMDIEGGEWLALKGAQKVWNPPHAPTSLLIEVHPEQIEALGGTVDAFRNTLESMGFTVQGLTPQGLVPLSPATFVRFWWAVSR